MSTALSAEEKRVAQAMRYAHRSGKPRIGSTVGLNGHNRPVDVAIVQRLLSHWLTNNKPTKALASAPGTHALPGSHQAVINQYVNKHHGKVHAIKVTGEGGSEAAFIEDIKFFQAMNKLGKSPDGLIGAEGTTFKKLRSLSSSWAKGHPRDWLFGSHVKLAGSVSTLKPHRAAVQLKKQLWPVRKFEKYEDFMTRIKGEKDLTDIRWAAYYIATAYVETSFTLNPDSKERGGGAAWYGKEVEVTDTNGIRGPKGAKYKNRFFGRGYIQLTHDYNYKSVSKHLGKVTDEFYIDPDRVLKPEVAWTILNWWFQTSHNAKGKPISDYISGAKCDYIKARNLVNPGAPLMKKKQLANYATTAELVLRLCSA